MMIENKGRPTVWCLCSWDVLWECECLCRCPLFCKECECLCLCPPFFKYFLSISRRSILWGHVIEKVIILESPKLVKWSCEGTNYFESLLNIDLLPLDYSRFLKLWCNNKGSLLWSFACGDYFGSTTEDMLFNYA